jgi:hypothetical protein
MLKKTRIYPKDIKKKYEISYKDMAKLLNLTEDCIYVRNYRKTPMKSIEIDAIKRAIGQSK